MNLRKRDFSGFVTFTPGRVFVNSSLGCPARCSYCYISDYGYGRKPTLAPFSGDELHEHLYDQRHLWQQSDYNIISFGCFSESMCKPYIQKTLEFVKAVASFGMPIQIATKWGVSEDAVEEFSSAVNCSGQLNIFASLVTLRHWENIEPGTRPPEERISTLLRFKEAGQNTYLYIKPVIPGITDADAPGIRDIMQKNGLDICVVGALFSNPQIVRALRSKIANVDSHSLDLHPQSTKFQVPGSAELRMAYPVSTLDQVIATLTTDTLIKTFYNSVDATKYKTIPQS
jgi:DNA repair photolyase